MTYRRPNPVSSLHRGVHRPRAVDEIFVRRSLRRRWAPPAAPSGVLHEVFVDDTLGLSDALVFERGVLIADTLALADQITFERGLAIDDVVSLADLITFAREMLIEESLPVTDALAFDRAIEILDAVALSDEIEILFNGLPIGEGVQLLRMLMGFGR